MKTIEITAVSRDQFGKKSSNLLRSEGNVPCVMYREKENLHFYAHENAFRGLVYTPDVFLINLIVDGKSYNAVMKDLQFHPVSDRLLHIDFMQVTDDNGNNGIPSATGTHRCDGRHKLRAGQTLKV